MFGRRHRGGLAARVVVAALACVDVAGCVARRNSGAQCVYHSECAEAYVCAGGACREPCINDRDCPSPARCISAGQQGRRACVPPASPWLCVENNDCPNATACGADHVCRAPCQLDRECAPYGAGATCAADHTCSAPVVVSPDAGDGSIGDVAADSDGQDASTNGPCDDVLDLTGVTPTADGVVFRSDTTMAPRIGRFTACGDGQFVHQVAARYRMHRDAFLGVDTQRGLTASQFDTMAAIYTSCAGTSTQLGCNDDARGDLRAIAYSGTPLSAGQEVVVVVGGLFPSTSMVSMGPIEVAITEIDAVARGATCDLAATASRCVAGGCAWTGVGRGTCVGDQTEREPNPRATPELVMTTPAVVRGHAMANDEDCVALDVPAGGSVVSEVTERTTRYCYNWALTHLSLELFGPAGVSIMRNTGNAVSDVCARIDGLLAASPARGLPAGRYTLCVQAGADAYDDYEWSIAVVP